MPEKTLTKTLTFGLGKVYGYDAKQKTIFPLADESRKLLYNEIRKGFRAFAYVCNYTTSLLYVEKILKVNLDSLGFNTGYKPILNHLQIETPLNGMVLNQAFGLAKAHFSGEHGKSLMRKGEISLPTHRSDGTHPLYFHKRAVFLYREENQFFIVYKLFSKAGAANLGLPMCIAFQIKIKKRDMTGFYQMEKIYNETWQHGSGQLVRNKRNVGPKYIMHLTVQYTPEPFKAFNPETVMGIDLGVIAPAAIHFRTNGKPEKWAMIIGNGRAMIQAKAIVRREITQLLRALKRKDSPIDGPEKEIYQAQLKMLRKREQRIMKTACQKIAAKIADQAKRNGAGIWQMEDLNLIDMKEGQPWLAKNWSAGMLLDAIRWQSTQLGTELVFVNPRNTSRRCSSCGHIDQANRPKGKKKAAFFECVKCGYKDNADKNAARNLSIIGIDTIIRDSV